MRQSPTAAPPARFPRKPSRSEHDTRPSGVGPPTRDGDPLRRLWRPGLPHGWVFRRMWSSLSDWPVQRLAPSLALPAPAAGERTSRRLSCRGGPPQQAFGPSAGVSNRNPRSAEPKNPFPPRRKTGGLSRPDMRPSAGLNALRSHRAVYITTSFRSKALSIKTSNFFKPLLSYAERSRGPIYTKSTSYLRNRIAVSPTSASP